MSARDESHKSQRYKLGELLRDSSDHILLLTATPHKGDPDNFIQGVERMTSVLVLPHPDRRAAEVRRHQPDPATEATAMRVVMDHEQAQERHVEDVSAKNLGYDVTSLDPNSGDLRLIEVKGLAARSGTILLTPNERRVAEDRPDCYWLYVVTDCATTPVLRDPVRNPARKPWVEVKKVRHYYLDVEKLSAAPDQRSDR